MRGRVGWWALWIVLGVALVLRTGGRDRGVITDHLEFGRRLAAGEDLYAPYLDAGRPLHPVYPPSFGLVTWPFAQLPERAARYAWGILQVLALAFIASRLRRWLIELGPSLVPRFHLCLAVTFALSARYVLRDAHGGGGNLINLALALGAVDQARSGRPLAAGAALGISLATKPTTVLLLPLLWLLGHGRAAVAGISVAIGMVGAALLVNGRGLEPLTRWVDGSIAYSAATDVFAEPALGFPPFSWMNQSLRCAFGRYFGTVPDDLAGEVPGFFDGFGLDGSSVAWLARIAALGLLSWTFWQVWRRSDRPLQHVAAVLTLSLLLSPISWKAHHVALLPALFLLACDVVRGDRFALRLAIAYFVICSVTGGDLIGDDLKNLHQSLYLVTLGDVGLLAYCLTRSRVGHGPSETRTEPPVGP